MPLTPKGKEILRELVKEYGEKKGKEVFYSGVNSGRFRGTHKLKTSKGYRLV